MSIGEKRSLWLRWVMANGLGEMFGLGLTLILGAWVISSLGDQGSITVILLSFLVAVASGAIEATVVGLAQWWAMHPWFSMIRRWTWWLATLVGALTAYVLGYLPSTLMSLGEASAQSTTAAAEPAQWLVLLLAAGLGAIGGAVLSFAQWLALRKNILRASLWIPANMLACMAGMPLIFLGIDGAQKSGSLPVMILYLAGTLLLTGMLVGAIEGAFLVKIAEAQNQRQ
jgi:hypothetical protein